MLEMLQVKFCAVLMIVSCVSGQYSSGSGDDIVCSDEGSIRLYNVRTDAEGEGAVQICYDNTWYAVCDYSWGCADANVACRELGYTNGASSIVYNAGYYFGYWSDIRDYYYYCSGSESSLDSCYGQDQYSFYYDRCVAFRDAAGVRCALPDDDTDVDDCSPNGAVRLVDGNATEGRVEYCYNGQWSAICRTFHDEEIAVTCRQLGFSPYGEAVSGYLYRTDNYEIRYIACSTYATENELQSCNIVPRSSSSSCTGSSTCYFPAAIRCYNSSGCSSGDVRLVGGAIAQEGRIEICVDGVWGSICQTGWDALDAYVVCRQLGYPGIPDISRASEYGYSDRPMVYSYVNCRGHEASISDCSLLEYLRFNCYYTYSAGVLCTDGCVEGSLRLVGSATELEGTVEACVNGLWGYIGDGGWNDADADVVCRQLGLPTGGATAVSNAKKTDRITVHYSHVLCEGTENILGDCRTASLSLDDGNAILKEATLAGVVCAENIGPPRYPVCLPKEAPTGPSECTSGNVRIMDDGQTLQYCYNGYWTGFCTMTHHEAMVACKQLGYTDYTWGLVYHDDYQYTSELTNSLVKNISCSGKENALTECTVHEGDCLTQCPRNVGLKCFEPTGCGEGAVRLNGGDIEQEGRVEVCVNGVWGSICDYGWDKTDAHVICKQLGYAELEPVAHKGSTFDEAEGPMVYSHVSCEGWEDDIRKCEKLQYEDFVCPHYTVAGVTCSNGCTEGEVRLVNGDAENEGTVEICYHDLWGLISDLDWDNSDAIVVCRQLGYSTTSDSLALTGSHYGKPNKTIHVGNVRCQGDEESLRQCSKTEYGLKEILASDISVAGVSCAGVIATEAPSSAEVSKTSSASNFASTIVLAIVVAVVVIGSIIIIAVLVFIIRRKKNSTISSTLQVANRAYRDKEDQEILVDENHSN